MTFRSIAALALTLTLAQGCSSHMSQDVQQVPGHRYKTRIGCVRIKSLDTFDARCDVPLLGYSGFSGL
ncbi:MAG: hypothetical protein QE284_11435 [Rhizobium sp.]|nr:hypothetical protein [Rhizobium sp.]